MNEASDTTPARAPMQEVDEMEQNLINWYADQRDGETFQEYEWRVNTPHISETQSPPRWPLTEFRRSGATGMCSRRHHIGMSFNYAVAHQWSQRCADAKKDLPKPNAKAKAEPELPED